MDNFSEVAIKFSQKCGFEVWITLIRVDNRRQKDKKRLIFPFSKPPNRRSERFFSKLSTILHKRIIAFLLLFPGTLRGHLLERHERKKRKRRRNFARENVRADERFCTPDKTRAPFPRKKKREKNGQMRRRTAAGREEFGGGRRKRLTFCARAYIIDGKRGKKRFPLPPGALRAADPGRDSAKKGKSKEIGR